jgi:hypothetical protein
MSQNGSSRFRSSLLAFAAGTLALTLASIGEAAPIQQGTNIEEGKCETVSVGQYFCKINGKCYYCDTKTNPDPNKNCYKETTCTAAMTKPGFKGMVRPPIGGRIMRRGVEDEPPAAEPEQDKDDAGDVKERAVKKPNPRPKPPIPPKEPPIGTGGTGPTIPK